MRSKRTAQRTSGNGQTASACMLRSIGLVVRGCWLRSRLCATDDKAMKKAVDFVAALVARTPGALDSIQAACTLAAWVCVEGKGERHISFVVRTKP